MTLRTTPKNRPSVGADECDFVLMSTSEIDYLGTCMRCPSNISQISSIMVFENVA